MIARDINPASPEDIAQVDRLIDENRGHNVRLKDDWIMAVDSGTSLVGLLVARPVMYCHELIIQPESLTMRRIIAESLVAHALSKGSVLGERYAHFTVDKDNMPMHNFMTDHQAVRQPDGVLYELEVPKAYYKGLVK